MRILPAWLVAAAALFSWSLPVSAASLTVGSGSTFDAGTGTLAMNCGDISVAGTLLGGSALFDQTRHFAIQPTGTANGQNATFDITGNWSNAGSFVPGTSTVNLIHGCSLTAATISGDSTFYSLNLGTSSGKTYFFQAGSTQIVTAFLGVVGAPGNLLMIRSTINGVAAFINLMGGDQLVDWVDVQDNNAIGEIIGPDLPEVFNSIKGSNSDGWFVRVVIPTLSVGGMLLFILLIMGMGWRKLRPAQIRTNRKY